MFNLYFIIFAVYDRYTYSSDLGYQSDQKLGHRRVVFACVGTVGDAIGKCR